MIQKLIRFAAAGMAATLLYAALAVLLHRAGLAATLASALAYCAAACFSYAAQRRAFASRRTHGEAVPRFAATNAIGLGVSLLVPQAVASVGGPAAAGFAAVCVIVPALNFVFLDRVVFRAKA